VAAPNVLGPASPGRGAGSAMEIPASDHVFEAALSFVDVDQVGDDSYERLSAHCEAVLKFVRILLEAFPITPVDTTVAPTVVQYRATGPGGPFRTYSGRPPSWSTPPVTSRRGCRGCCGREDRRGMLPGPRQPLPFRGPRSAVGHRRGDRPTPAGQNRRPQVGCYSFDRSLPPAAGNGTFWRRTWPSATALPSSRTTLTLHSCSVRPC